MKKVILFATAVIAISMASCVKERECECKSTYTPAGGTAATTTTVYIYKDVTKRQAKMNCISSTYTDAAAGTHTEDCELK